ncbi:hypothetical protein CSUI_005279, partial [Cystoisospora suis]
MAVDHPHTTGCQLASQFTDEKRAVFTTRRGPPTAQALQPGGTETFSARVVSCQPTTTKPPANLRRLCTCNMV